MRRRRTGAASPISHPSIELALSAMAAEDLRALVLELVPLLPHQHRALWVDTALDRAARRSGAATVGPQVEEIERCLAAIAAAKARGSEDPATVDAMLLRAKCAFLAREFTVAALLFRAVLVPVCNAEFDLGQDECVFEVLGVDLTRSAAEAAVSLYWTSDPNDRARVILELFDELGAEANPRVPLRDLEEVAREPLPQFDEFLREWSSLLEARVATGRDDQRRYLAERWLVEARERGFSAS